MILEENFGEEEYGVGFRKGDEKLASAVDEALDELKADGTASEISMNWFGHDLIKQ